jgi:trehalose-phosphatase
VSQAPRSELQPLLADPARTAILTDIDGTLAPIVDDPAAAAVPAEAREVLAALAQRYGLVGCISGRQATEARRIVGLDELAYAGNHGLELLLPGDPQPRPDPGLAGQEEAARDFLAGTDRAELGSLGVRLEDKGPIQALHWRGAPDEEAAERRTQEIAAAAVAGGLATHRGRKVLELRPPGGADKGRAVAALLGEDFTAATYAGDDHTDLDAFARLRDLVSGESLQTALCVGVISPEAPAGLGEQSDFTVEGPAGWLELLSELAA